MMWDTCIDPQDEVAMVGLNINVWVFIPSSVGIMMARSICAYVAYTPACDTLLTSI